ncbi:MAG TPA: hypothetical protein P5079_08990 [Elusimicrobiota bacterium]|nr:hypothetical protein [Elusimicrobiota bacterium]
MKPPASASLALCLASPKEAAEFCRRAEKTAGLAGNILLTGYRNASLDTVPPQKWAGDVLAAGFAGALRPTLDPGDLLLAERVCSEDAGVLETSASLTRSIATALREENIPYVTGTLLTVSRAVTGASKKRELRGKGFDAVDMESHGLLAHGRGRIAALRLISDRADETAASDYAAARDALSEKFSRVLGRVFDRLSRSS